MKHHPKGSHRGVAAKKHLGQHFLRDMDAAQRIADTLTLDGYDEVLEIGPGTGVLTQFLLKKDAKLTVMELDRESVEYLSTGFRLDHPGLVKKDNFKIISTDFLKEDLGNTFRDKQFAIIGNYPYNISTQIVFRMLEYRDQVPQFSGMFQKEVAARICADHGNKTYGILSVIAQAYYDCEYSFTVGPEAFNPPPRVDSGVITLSRKRDKPNIKDHKHFHRTVKTAFNQRRKTLRNSLKGMPVPDAIRDEERFNKRPEQMSVQDFIDLSNDILAHS